MNKNKNKKIFFGKVLSIKNKKTIIVLVKILKKHYLYKKFFFKKKKILVHDEYEIAKLNNIVSFISCKPISKKKFWILKDIINNDTKSN
ncbi:putative 30S ribosomal subunit protein S17 [Candidatus Zinderia insecticola CARI]|uniref:30S ribosomal protein S17 n=1 Tax=Zinderia insecticola (strain CARI) TaxID=871271 RepID=E0TJ39_ZINIC|nr:putative 30S ribosomal subunit protein S17 [Candidatus Zinderia insecticola CARI]